MCMGLFVVLKVFLISFVFDLKLRKILVVMFVMVVMLEVSSIFDIVL